MAEFNENKLIVVSNSSSIELMENGLIKLIIDSNKNHTAKDAIKTISACAKMMDKMLPLFIFVKGRKGILDRVLYHYTEGAGANVFARVGICFEYKIYYYLKKYTFIFNVHRVHFYKNQEIAIASLRKTKKIKMDEKIDVSYVYAGLSFLCFIMISFFIDSYLQDQNNKKLTLFLESYTIRFKENVKILMDERMDAFDRMADRFALTTFNDSKIWMKDSQNYLKNLKDIYRIEWFDQNRNLRFKYPSNITNMGLKYKELQRLSQIKKESIWTDPIQVAENKNIIFSIHPILNAKGKVEHLVVSYNLNDILKQFTDRSVLLNFNISGKNIYRDSAFDEYKTGHGFSQIQKFNIKNIECDFEFRPSLILYKRFKSSLSYSVIYGLSVLSFFLSWLILLLSRFRQKVQKTSERYELFNAAINETALVSETDINGKITYANDKFCETSQYSRAELLGKNHRIVSSGEHSKMFFHDMWQTISSGRNWSGEIKNKAKDGSYYWVRSTIHPKMNSEGMIIGYISIRFNITEKKKQEFEIIRAKNNALRAERAKSQFLANMSHEIRTPMNGILGMVQLLNETTLSKEQEEMLETTRACGDSLLTILNDI